MLKRYFMILTVGLSLAFAPVVSSAESSAIDAVRTTVEAVLDILKKDGMDTEARRSAMETEIGKRFDDAQVRSEYGNLRQQSVRAGLDTDRARLGHAVQLIVRPLSQEVVRCVVAESTEEHDRGQSGQGQRGRHLAA